MAITKWKDAPRRNVIFVLWDEKEWQYPNDGKCEGKQAASSIIGEYINTNKLFGGQFSRTC